MDIGDPIDPRLPWVRRVRDLEEDRAIRSAGVRLAAYRRRGRVLGDALREGPRVVCVRTLPVSDLLYPTRFAFDRAFPLPWPYVLMRHRCLLVQVMAEGELRTILWNPTDRDASRATPFFRKMIDRIGERAADRLAGPAVPLEDQLAALGLATTDVDLIAFDHFHTQDLRPSLGGVARGARLEARFPNALLLAPRREWEDWGQLHPMQRAWFVADGREGVPEERVVLFDADVILGDGCLLLRTPGHTTGNQTLFVHADRGVFGCSENGCSADSWTPRASRIPGLRRFAERYEVDVVLNSNTPELGAEQYNSMSLEAAVVDRAPGGEFVQMFPSSEVSPSVLAPGVLPSMIFGERDSGSVRRRG